MSAEPGPAENLVRKIEALLSAIIYDDSGFQGKGGNGGLISRETIRKADETRIALHTFRRTQAEAPR